jgi:hypothetical protein
VSLTSIRWAAVLGEAADDGVDAATDGEEVELPPLQAAAVEHERGGQSGGSCWVSAGQSHRHSLAGEPPCSSEQQAGSCPAR